METKPFSIQSPETIAKQYGGNKQKIAQAMQMGIIDPTAGTLAGMFIDRMRSAAQQEQTPQQTVAQQVMAPQQQAVPSAPPMGVPAGLGATPQAAQMPQPMTMGQPSAPPPGMAAGGLVAFADGGMAMPGNPAMPATGVPNSITPDGGLAALSVPSDMFNSAAGDNDSQQYAGGGLVAFAKGANGEEVDENGIPVNNDLREIVSTGLRQKNAPPVSFGSVPMFDIPQNIFGLSSDAMTNLTNYQDMYTPKTKQQDRLTAAYEEELTPESIKKAKKEDMWLALGQIGAKMASTPGSFLQAASAGMAEALPGIRAAAKERKADQRQLLKNLQEQEGLSNKEAKEAANIALDMQVKYGTLAQAMQDNAFKERWANMDDATRRYVAKLTAGSSAYNAQLGLQGTLGAAAYGYNREMAQQQGLARKYVLDNIGPGGAFAIEYSKAPDKTRFISDKVGAVIGSGGTSGGDAVTVPWK
jgi:hypothetical protein